jgi:two-component system response regulator HydG
LDAELIVMNGPLAGTRYSLDGAEILIGRAPNARIVLSDPDIGWRHSQIVRRGGRFVVIDLKTSVGTYVNGTRSAERWLEDRDQIGIGKTILMFRSGEQDAATSRPSTISASPILLSACSLLFLFRALGSSTGSRQTKLLKRQILRLAEDLIPAAAAVLLLGGTHSELASDLAVEPPPQGASFEGILARVCEEGASAEGAAGLIAVPLYLSGNLAGAMLIQLRDSERGHFQAHLETLTSIASLASIGLEANQEIETLKAENALLQEQIGFTAGICGNSPAIHRLLQLIDRVAPRDTTVLITGESGTGKELVARALHQKSPRRERPFIAVNCAALTESLFESEIFGHEKGAFTGAIALKRGRFELAQGGTIFLDEIGELALSLQAKLLRVIQQREFERVGGTQSHPLDVRIIAATNRDLALEVREGKFREDLYHRLNVVALHSPPLRERSGDLPLLAAYFLQRAAERCKRRVLGISKEAEELLVAYSWPGNVRELENAMERAVVLGVSDWVLPEDLPEALLESASHASGAKYHHSVGQAKREAILDAYKQGSGDYKQAAKLLGIHPNYLLRLVRNLDLRDEINRVLAGVDGRQTRS